MRAVVILGLLALPLLAGCAREEQPGPPVPPKSFVLHDVQGLWGGYALWASEDRTAFVQVVDPPPAKHSELWEKRYKVKLTAEQWAEVERLVGAYHFLTLQVSERPGVPDEAHPIIVVVTKAGVTTKAQKWANDKHADFDPVYSYLLGLCRADGMLVREGSFEWEWRPEGFEQPW
jgi:hypothetical protein